MKKYTLVKEDTKVVKGHTLYRIKSLKDFNDVKVGDLGGYVESEDNLSHNGNCWIYDDSTVYDSATTIKDDATVKDNSSVHHYVILSDRCSVDESSEIANDVTISGNVQITNSNIQHDCKIDGIIDIVSSEIQTSDITGDISISKSKIFHSVVSKNVQLTGVSIDESTLSGFIFVKVKNEQVVGSGDHIFKSRLVQNITINTEELHIHHSTLNALISVDARDLFIKDSDIYDSFKASTKAGIDIRNSNISYLFDLKYQHGNNSYFKNVSLSGTTNISDSVSMTNCENTGRLIVQGSANLVDCKFRNCNMIFGKFTARKVEFDDAINLGHSTTVIGPTLINRENKPIGIRLSSFPVITFYKRDGNDVFHVTQANEYTDVLPVSDFKEVYSSELFIELLDKIQTLIK